MSDSFRDRSAERAGGTPSQDEVCCLPKQTCRSRNKVCNWRGFKRFLHR